MVVATDHVGHAHIVIVNHDGVHIGRRPVRAQKDHVVERGVLDRDVALHLVGDQCGAVAGGLEADHEGRVRMVGAVAPGAVEQGAFAFFARGVPEGGDFVLGGEAFVGGAIGEHLFGHFAVPVGAGELADGLAIVVEAKPGHAVEDRLGGFGRRALAVGVLDPEQERAAMTSREEPVEQAGARSADVHHARGRGGDAGDDGGRGGHAGPFQRVTDLRPH